MEYVCKILEHVDVQEVKKTFEKMWQKMLQDLLEERCGLLSKSEKSQMLRIIIPKVKFANENGNQYVTSNV